MEQFESYLRGMVTACLRDLEPYVGLSVEEAKVRATATGDLLCVHDGPTGHRSDWRSDRVHVEVGPDGHVMSARLGSRPWEHV
jgi:hypothetical protein